MKRVFNLLLILLICISSFSRNVLVKPDREVYITDPITGDSAYVDDDHQLHVVAGGKVDINNSSATPLGANIVFTGSATSVLKYAVIVVSVYTDVASAIDGLQIQQSTDGTNWDHCDEYTIPAATGKTFSFQPQATYLRVVYTNGSTIQTEFRLQTTLKKTYVKPSSHRIQDPIIDDDDAELVKSVITGKKTNGTFDNVSLTNGSNMKISLEELESGISSNSNSQLNVTPFHADGTEGNLITGVDYVSGKSGIDASTETLQYIEYAHHEIHSGSHYYISGSALLGVAGTFYVKLQTPDSTRWGHFLWDITSTGILTTSLQEDATGGMANGSRATIHANNRNTNCWTGRHTGGNDEATVLTDSTKSWTINELTDYQVFNTLDGSAGIITSNTATTATVSALAGGTGNDFDTGDEYEINSCTFEITSGVTVCTDSIQALDTVTFGSKAAGGNISREDELILKQNTVYCRGFVSGTATNHVTFKANWYQHADKN